MLLSYSRSGSGPRFEVPRSALSSPLVSPAQDLDAFLAETVNALRELLCGFHGRLLLVVPDGSAPSTHAYRARGPSWNRDREWCALGELNTGPPACRAGARSAELSARCWYSLAGSSRVLPGCRPGAFPSGSGSVKFGTGGEIRTRTVGRFEGLDSAVGLRRRIGTRPEIRTPTGRLLKPLPLPLG